MASAMAVGMDMVIRRGLGAGTDAAMGVDTVAETDRVVWRFIGMDTVE
jgi:hypothetical protein